MSKPTSPTLASLVQEVFTDYMVQHADFNFVSFVIERGLGGSCGFPANFQRSRIANQWE